MNLTEWLNLFNNITAPFGFVLTIFTFFFARATKNKLKESRELTRFDIKRNQFDGKLDGIKEILDKKEERNAAISEKVITEIFRIISEFESEFPYICSHNKSVSQTLKKIKLFKNKDNITFIEFIDSFEKLYILLSSRKDLK